MTEILYKYDYDYPTPKEIKKELDRYIIGQDNLKKMLSTIIYNRQLRMVFPQSGLKKSNVLLMGPTGSGKTYTVEILAQLLDLPLVITDSSKYSPSGYIGPSVTDCLKDLLKDAWEKIPDEDSDKETYSDRKKRVVEIAEMGIILLDEIDKLANTREASYKSTDIQAELLKFIEGENVPISYNGGSYNLSTKNILFILAGAFPGLDDIIYKRTATGGIGFTSDPKTKNLFDKVLTEDIIKYGFLSEFVGRIGIYSSLSKLTKNELKSILTKAEDNLVDEYKSLFAFYGRKLKFSSEAIDLIVEKAYSRNTGARSLRLIMEASLLEHQYQASDYFSNKINYLIKESDIKEYFG